MNLFEQSHLSTLASRAALLPATSSPQAGDESIALLAKLLVNQRDFGIPAFDYEARTYVGSTNNVATRVFKTGGASGTVVATLTYAYAASGAADNDRVTSITRS